MALATQQTSLSGQGTDAQRILALDSLTRLTRRFARTPEIGSLAEETLLIMAGQLGVGSALLVVLNHADDHKRPRLFGIGQIRDGRAFAPILNDPGWDVTIRNVQGTWLLDRGHALDNVARWTVPIMDAGISVISPFRCNEECVGYLALGKRLTGKRFSAEDLEFLETMTNTVAPLFSSTRLLERITWLNERHRTILDSVGQGVFVFDHQHRLIHVNAAGIDLLTTIVGANPLGPMIVGRDLDEIFPDLMYPSWSNRIQQCITGNAAQRFENLIAHGPEGDRVFNVQIGDVKREGALPDAEIIVTLDDITVQQEGEERLFELQRFAERGMMAASIAHELNNFLGMMMGGIELARVAIRSGDTEKVSARLAKLQDSATQMERFTGGLMDLGRLKTQKAPTDLNAVIRSVVSFAGIQKRFKSIRTTLDLDSGLPEIDLDEDQIAQVLINLLNNAADAIRESETSNGEIRVKTLRTEGFASMVVADNGPGMNPDVRKQLFTRQITTKKTGHGFGLVTCHRIINDHGGSISVESEPGRGTNFSITLPIN